MKALLSFCIVSCVFFISCNKEDNNTSEEQQADETNFYGLKVGNTWTYEYFKRIGNTEEFETTNAFDEVKITGTSEINGEVFYSLETTTTGNDGAPVCVPQNGTANIKVRDSLGYLINDTHQILFSNKNEQEYLAVVTPQAYYDLFGILISGIENVEVTAGTFPSLRNELYAKFTDGTISPGRNITSYSDEIGEIKATYSFVSGVNNYAEKRLVSYLID